MAQSRIRRFLPATVVTMRAVVVATLAILLTVAGLAWVYASLPDLLPVRFRWDGRPIGWQFRTFPRVIMPAVVQLGLLATCGAVSALLLYRGNRHAGLTPEGRAAQDAAEAVMLIAATWVGFQAYAAFALTRMWGEGRSSLGPGYTLAEGACLAITIGIGLRAQRRLGRPTPPVYVAAHWRLRELYCNADDPALFVPTRRGGRWTLNFGRPAAVLLLGGVLAVGIVLPTLMLALALR